MLPIRLFICHRSVLLVEGLCEILRKEPTIEIVGTESNSAAAIDALRATRPDIVLVGSEFGGDTALLSVAATLPARTILLASGMEESKLLEALRFGVSGIILDTMSSRLLIACIRKVHSGEEWIEKVSTQRLLQRLLHQEAFFEHLSGLSRREIDIVKCVGRGHSNREAAEQLFISEATVKSHLHNVFAKLNIKSRRELHDLAREKGIV